MVLGHSGLWTGWNEGKCTADVFIQHHRAVQPLQTSQAARLLVWIAKKHIVESKGHNFELYALGNLFNILWYHLYLHVTTFQVNS